MTEFTSAPTHFNKDQFIEANKLPHPQQIENQVKSVVAKHQLKTAAQIFSYYSPGANSSLLPQSVEFGQRKEVWLHEPNDTRILEELWFGHVNSAGLSQNKDENEYLRQFWSNLAEYKTGDNLTVSQQLATALTTIQLYADFCRCTIDQQNLPHDQRFYDQYLYPTVVNETDNYLHNVLEDVYLNHPQLKESLNHYLSDYLPKTHFVSHLHILIEKP